MLLCSAAVRGFDSQDEFIEFADNSDNLKHFLAGVMFNETNKAKWKKDSAIPQDLMVVYRFNSDPVNRDEASTNQWAVV